ncbi:MAG: hypothetical protein ABIJ09_26675 [Pseudomonadota bacterium]
MRAYELPLLGALAFAGALGLTACPTLDYDLNDAELAITPEGETESTLTHQPGRSEVRITPPIDGTFTATFSYLDPRTELRIGIEDKDLAENSNLPFPLDAQRATLQIEYQDATLRAASEGTQGFVTIERLDVGEDRVSFRASFQGTLLSEDGSKAATSGFIDAIYEGSSER